MNENALKEKRFIRIFFYINFGVLIWYLIYKFLY